MSRRVDQTIFVGDEKRKGNCVAACVASLFDLSLTEVPHFIDYGIALGDSDDVHAVSSGDHWWAMMVGFLAAKGVWPVELGSLSDAEPDELLMVAGTSPRGVLHQVIYRGGELWHDPHPSRDGVLDVQEVLALRPLGECGGFDHTPTESVQL